MRNLLLFIFFFSATNQYYSQTFSEVSLNSGVNHIYHQGMLMGGGVAIFDFNNDGWEDLYLTGGDTSDFLYQNNGDGTYTDVSSSSNIVFTDSIYTVGVIAGDIENDGDKDLFITTWGVNFGFYNDAANILLKNNGNGTFTNISTAAGITDTAFSVSASFGDINLDGYLDIYVVNYIEFPSVIYDTSGTALGYDHIGQPNFLYVNNGDGTFTESATSYSVADTGCGLGVAFTDSNQDYLPDLFISNDFGQWEANSTLYQNNFPTSSFTNVGGSGGINSQIFGMGVAIADYDEDGDLDYYETNIGRNIFYQNQGSNLFSDISDSNGTANTWILQDSLTATGWGCAFADFDNDTYQDLYVSNGYMETSTFPLVPYSAVKDNENALFKNDGNGNYSNIAQTAGVNNGDMGRGCAIGDLNNDGHMDIVQINIRYPSFLQDSTKKEHTLVYQNDGQTTGNWLKVKLNGIISNKDGIGSLIVVTAGGKRYIREIDGGSSHCSHNSTIAHFGLGTISAIDTMTVTWPGGKSQLVHNIGINQLIEVNEDTATTTINPGLEPNHLTIYPNPCSDYFRINSHALDYAISVFSLDGKLMVTQQEIQNNIVSTRGLAPGTYIIEVITDNYVTRKRLVKNYY